VLDAALFGVGWGLGGFCPGPGIVAGAAGPPSAIAFVAAMTAGVLLEDLFLSTRSKSKPSAEKFGT
jgi:hypothetical protein